MTWAELVALAHITTTARALNLGRRYNVAPTQDVAVVRPAADGGREAVMMRWGLVPSWAKDLAIGSLRRC